MNIQNVKMILCNSFNKKASWCLLLSLGCLLIIGCAEVKPQKITIAPNKSGVKNPAVLNIMATVLKSMGDYKGAESAYL